MLYLIWRFLCLVIFSSLLLIGSLYYYIEFQLPDTNALKIVQLQVPLQIFTRDGKLIAQYGEKHRIPVAYNDIPPQLINALLATEDQRYFQHAGIDVPGLFRAFAKLLLTGKKEEGGSTITMQVARSFYLSPHKTFGRKLREVLLALKIDHTLSKQKILELYLNKIFLGYRAYGVAAAAKVYYGKPLNELTLDQLAVIAGLPKAPSSLNPLTNPEGAKKRRNHVLTRMYELHYIDKQSYQQALAAPINAHYHDVSSQVKAPYVGEMARQQLEEMYGDIIYTAGFNVYTTLDAPLQEAANQALDRGLLAYDQRHGYRGPEKNLGQPTPTRMIAWKKYLSTLPSSSLFEGAVTLQTKPDAITAMRANGSLITLPWQGMAWARRQINENYLGRLPKTPGDVLKIGDVIRIMPDAKTGWRLTQRPQAEAGIVALNPSDGSILALVGGFDFQASKFNRITSAQRQPGSSFKPFIYSAAFNKGYTLATIINDAPVVVANTTDNSFWRPQNDTRLFYGPTRLREALIHSRNLVSIRLLSLTGIPYTLDYLQRFGFDRAQLPATLSLALGTASVTPLQLATGYAVFANGGYRPTPYLITSIRNTQGQLIYQTSPSTQPATEAESNRENPPTIKGVRVISAENAFLMTSALQDVIQRGTASAAKSLQRSDLAGKTGTTNNQVDAWFVGYNAALVTATWVGFDQPRSLHEYGAQAALPIWIDFMHAALANRPPQSLDQPPGIVSMQIDPVTGTPAQPNDPAGIFEVFAQPYLPSIVDTTVAAHTTDSGNNSIY